MGMHDFVPEYQMTMIEKGNEMTNSAPVILTADMQIRPNEEEAAIGILKQLAVKSRQEAGCLIYEFHQGKMEKASFFLLEKWADKEAFSSHRNSEHLRTAMEALTPISATPTSFKVWAEV